MKLKSVKYLGVLLGLLASLPQAWGETLSDESIIKIWILGIFKPQTVYVEDHEKKVHTLSITVDQKSQFLKFEHGFQITIPGKIVRKYAGELEVVQDGQTLILINHVKIKDYLASVILSEMGGSSLQALAAQAVMSRTIAYQLLTRKAQSHWHATDLTDVQVYKGMDFTSALGSKAVGQTTGETLWYQEALAEIFFSSTCGGRTSLPRDVWGGAENLGYQEIDCKLMDADLCQDSPHWYWQWKVRLLDLQQALQIKELKWLKILEKDEAGRVKKLLLETENEVAKTLSGYEFHREIGRYYKSWGKLKSTRFEIRCEEDWVLFSGSGLGHGVGLCQYGAMRLAKLGKNYREILRFYFPLFLIKK